MAKVGKQPGPFTLNQATYKYAAIAKDLMLAIAEHAPAMKLSTAAGAVGAQTGKWWGGNLKGLWLNLKHWYPDIIAFMGSGANAGGLNVMTYDVSDNQKYHECPAPGVCSLDAQVNFYMKTYKAAGIPAAVGYEIGTPAYPSPTEDPTHQLPLTTAELSKIVGQTQGTFSGGFFWSLFKPAAGHATPTQVAQAVCKAVSPTAKRCAGVVPDL